MNEEQVAEELAGVLLRIDQLEAQQRLIQEQLAYYLEVLGVISG